jgi:hypothetical protein
VIKALAAHQIIAAAQANYTYELSETKVQSATSQQGDPANTSPTSCACWRRIAWSPVMAFRSR